MRTMAIVCITVLIYVASASRAKADTIECKGPTGFPPAGMTAPFCHNGRMGFAATEYAPLSTAANMPRMRASDFARQEAEMKARGAIAKFLNDSSVWEASIRSSNMVDSSERQAWLTFVSNTQVQTVRARLGAGVALVAAEERDGAVYVTVATSPDMKDMAGSINDYRPSTNGAASSRPDSAGVDGKRVDPHTVVPKNVAPGWQ